MSSPFSPPLFPEYSSLPSSLTTSSWISALAQSLAAGCVRPAQRHPPSVSPLSRSPVSSPSKSPASKPWRRRLSPVSHLHPPVSCAPGPPPTQFPPAPIRSSKSTVFPTRSFLAFRARMSCRASKMSISRLESVVRFSSAFIGLFSSSSSFASLSSSWTACSSLHGSKFREAPCSAA